VDHQRNLSSTTKQLSEFLERDHVDIKKMVQDKCKYCKSRCEVLLALVHELVAS
jgi:hypothetical protein